MTSFHWTDLYIFLLSLLFSIFWEISLITSSRLFKGEKTLLIIECVYVCFAYCYILNGCNSALHIVEIFFKMLKWIYECYHILLTSWMFLFLASYFCFLKILIFLIIIIINVWGFSCNTLYSLLLLSFLFVCFLFVCLSFISRAFFTWLVIFDFPTSESQKCFVFLGRLECPASPWVIWFLMFHWSSLNGPHL